MLADNLELLTKKNPTLAFSCQFNQKQVEYPSLQRVKKANTLFLHGASVEAIEKLRPHCELLCVLDDVWHPFLDEAPAIWFHDPNIEFYDTQNENDWVTLAWRTLFKPWDLIDLKAVDIRHKLELYKSGVEMSLSDFKDFGLSHYQHMKQNWREKRKVLVGAKDALKGEAAILCGAGPSLKEHFEALKQTEGHIFAGGRALQILYEKGIRVDFAGVIDPVFSHPDIENWVQGSKALFYQDRVAPEMCVGNAVWCGVPEGYPHLNWFYEQMGIELQIDAGWNVLNFLTSVARYLGCDPIVYVGQDLKYHNDQKYAIDVEHVDNMALQGDSKADFKMAAKWVEDQNLNLTTLDQVAHVRRSTPIFDTCETKPPVDQFEKSLTLAAIHVGQALEQLKVTKGFNPRFTLYEVELKEEICYASLLRPLWNLYRGSFGIDGGVSEAQPFEKEQLRAKICEYAFYKRVLKQYGIHI